MRFKMPSATNRPDSSVALFRQRVPRDVVERVRGRTLLLDLPAYGVEPETTVAVTVSHQVKFSLRCREPAVVKARVGAVVARLNHTWDAVRQGPVRLSHRQVVALSGEVYRHLIETCSDDPGQPSSWEAIKAWGRAVAEGRVIAPPSLHIDPRVANDEALARALFGVDLTAGINSLAGSDNALAGLETRYGVITSWLLMKRGIEIDAETRSRLLKAVHGAVEDACRHLRRNAEGDYTPDARASRFPAFTNPAPLQAPLTLTEIFERWRKEAQPAFKTLMGWQSVMKRFHEFLGHDDARRVTADDVVRYKDALIASGKTSARTINATHIPVLRRIYSFAIQNRMLSENPAIGVIAADRVRAGQRRLPYSEAEVAQILALAEKERGPARRWVPMLLAYTGARASEITQLWGDHIVYDEGVPCIQIRPSKDGGTLKTASSERVVPIHPALIAAGFMDYVKACGDKPLFYTAAPQADAVHPSSVVTTRIAEWIRYRGFKDVRKSPNHAFRHYVKSKFHEVGVDPVTADAIQGHSGRGEASGYRHFAVTTLAEAISKLPVPSLPPSG